MTRLRRILQPVNWKYALGELVLIITGILIALAASAWSERVRDAQAELKYLREIRSALASDLDDVQSNLTALNDHTKAVNKYLDYYIKRAPYSDSVQTQVSQFLGAVNHVQNRGAYESLKARGLDLIRNDSVRFAITQLYEAQYSFTNQIDAVALRSWVEWTQVLSNHFSLIEDWSPRDYDRTLNDVAFRSRVEWWLMYLSVASGIERNLEAQISNVLRVVDAELHRRGEAPR